ncbi:MAG: TonB-dependent receptor [Halothiobacillaceae bacterium]
MRRFLPLLTLPVLLAPAGALLAAAVEPELAIAPSRLPQRLDESPSAVTVIDREMLREAGVRRIADILRLVPGMVVGSRSPAVQPATYLGLSDDYSRRVQVLVDGISIYAPSTGAVLWQDLPLAVEDIDRIEVVRGPNTAAYGSHALLATIKITTVVPREVSRWEAGGAIGSNGVRDAHARLAGSGSAGAWMLSVVHQQDDGLDGRAVDDRGGRRMDGVRLKGELDLSPSTDMQWQLGAARARNGIGAALEQDVSGTINDAFLDENDHQFLTLHHRPDGGASGCCAWRAMRRVTRRPMGCAMTGSTGWWTTCLRQSLSP